MTLELEAKPARGRWKTAREISADLDETPDTVHLTDEAEMHGTPQSIMEESEAPDPQEITADELAELAERGRKGLASVELPDGWGEVNDPTAMPTERPITVTAYGPDGEAIDVTQSIPYGEPQPKAEAAPAPEGVAPPAGTTTQITMPGFDAPVNVDKVVIAFAGSIELDRTVPQHRALLAACEWKSSVALLINATVRDVALQERADDRARVSLKVTTARLYEPPQDARNPYDDDPGDETLCDRCGEELAIDGLYCGACIAEMDAEDDEDTAATVEPEPGTQLDQALAEALAVVGEDDTETAE